MPEELLKAECDHCTRLFAVLDMKAVIRRGYQSYAGQLWPMQEEKQTLLCEECYRLLKYETDAGVLEIEDDPGAG